MTYSARSFRLILCALGALVAFASTAQGQTQILPGPGQYRFEWLDPTFTNTTTGLASDFQTTGSGKGNGAGSTDVHRIADIGGSGVGANVSMKTIDPSGLVEQNYTPFAWNREFRPALEPYFPSSYDTDGEIIRVWNDPTALAGRIPFWEIKFDIPVKVYEFSFEGTRANDAWKIELFDAAGNLVEPNWADPNAQGIIPSASPLVNRAINIIDNDGGTFEAEAVGSVRYDAGEKAYYAWNRDNVFERTAEIINYNGTIIETARFSMIEVDPTDGTPTGGPADQSIYLGGGWIIEPVPEPSSALLLLLSGMAFLARRRR